MPGLLIMMPPTMNMMPFTMAATLNARAQIADRFVVNTPTADTPGATDANKSSE